MLPKEVLYDIENMAIDLYREAENRMLLTSGKSAARLDRELYALARELYGFRPRERYTIARSGKNTNKPFEQDLGNRFFEEEDILTLDLGALIDPTTTQLGRTHVIGANSTLIRLKDDVETCWYATKAFIDQNPSCTGKEVFSFVTQLASDLNWKIATPFIGYVLGEDLDRKAYKTNPTNFICPANKQALRLPNAAGSLKEWVLFIQFTDKSLKRSAVFKQLLVL